jgi:mannosyltransferase
VSGGASAGAAGQTRSRGGVSKASERERARALRPWWPLVAVALVAAGWRLGTLGSQSLWYDEAFTPVHVLHSGLGATLRAVAHTENSPPLWYVVEWAVTRAFGAGAFALRLISAVAGIGAVVVAWGIGSELAGRRAAIVAAGLVAVNPLFVWYSQEARAYGLFVLTAALAMLCFVRALARPTRERLLLFALSACAALLTHYFAAFLLIPMAVLLLFDRGPRARAREESLTQRARASGTNRFTLAPVAGALRRALYAIAAPTLAGAALIPLILAQAGHGTQWIGRWALANRLEAIPQYYLTGYTGASLGHGIELLVFAIALAGLAFGLWRGLDRAEERGALIALAITACGVLIPIALAVLGADYLAPRNLVGAMVPATALLAVVIVARRAGRAGMALAGLLALAFAALSVDVYLSPRLQRGDWAGLARAIGPVSPSKAITTVELGSAPLQYYLPQLRNLRRGVSVTVSEIDETGYAPLRLSAGSPPAPGFHLAERRDVHGLILYKFVSPRPVVVSDQALRAHVITRARPEVFVAPATKRSTGRGMH